MPRKKINQSALFEDQTKENIKPLDERQQKAEKLIEWLSTKNLTDPIKINSWSTIIGHKQYISTNASIMRKMPSDSRSFTLAYFRLYNLKLYIENAATK